MLCRGTMQRMLLCLASGTAFGAMAVFGKLAYDNGATVGTLLVRPLRVRRRAVLVDPPRSRGELGRAGGTPSPGSRSARVAYSLQAGCFFAALERIDASLLSLAALHVPGDRRRAPRSRSAASGSMPAG